MSNLEEEEMENHQQTEEIEEAEGNEEINEKENEDNDQILNNTIIESLVTRTKKLQEENAQLKQDIENISTSNKGNALQYFTNIRKEIFTKIDTLNKQIQDFNKNKIIENKKQKRDMEYINGQLNEATELNKNLKAQLENITNEIQQNDNIIKQEENVELKNLPNNDQVEDLDEKINSLTAEITKNEYLIKDQTETINELQETYETQTKELNEQYEDIKNKYHNLLGSAEIIEDQLDKDFSEKTKEFQKNMENNIYALTKKLLYSNNNLSQKNLEKENLKQQCIGQIEQKNSEITDLKNQIKEYQTKYELLYKLSIDQLNKFGNNYAKFKTTFFNREKDCINVYNYYKDMMEQYNKPLLDEENPNNKLEKDYHEKASAVINLQQENEKLLSDLENIKQKKYKESKEIRSEINTNVDKNEYSEINKVMNEIINVTKQYKNRNMDDLKESVIKMIKYSKIDPELLKNQDKETLAHLIIKLDKYERVEIIIESYINLLGINDTFFDWLLCENISNQTSLDLCAQIGNKDIIKYMYSIISKTTENKFRITENRKGIFHYAAMFNQCYPIIYFHEKLQKFFKKITIIDIPSELGITPLHCACIRGSRNAVDLLLDLGANINAVDNDGNNCLHYAVNSNNITLVKKLLVRGADKTIRNNRNQLPLDLAILNNSKTITDILSAKNSIIQNPCSKNQEITGLRSNHNNITLFVIILFMGLAKWIYLFRISYIYEEDLNKLDVIPFVYEIETIKRICYYGNYQNYTNCSVDDTLIKNFIKETNSFRAQNLTIGDLFNNETFGYNNLDKIYIAGWGISFFEVIILFFILKFMCFSGHIFLKKKSFKKQSSLIKLFETETNICVKCRTAKDNTTVHCIVCNGCVRNFDHHCSWLNICISEKNLGWFRGFLYLFVIYILVNLVFFSYSK